MYSLLFYFVFFLFFSLENRYGVYMRQFLKFIRLLASGDSMNKEFSRLIPNIVSPT